MNTLVGMHDGELAIEDHSGFALSLGAFPEAQTGSFFAKPANWLYRKGHQLLSIVLEIIKVTVTIHILINLYPKISSGRLLIASLFLRE